MIPSNVLKFATKDNLGVYEKFQDYYNHYRSINEKKSFTFSEKDTEGNPITFAEKELMMSAALKREIMRVAGIQNFEQFPLEQWVTNPMLNWATFAVISGLVEVVIPDVIFDSFGLFTDIKNIGWGDSALFEVESNGLFTVSKAGRAQRTTEMYKEFKGNVSIVPEPRQLTVGVSLYRVLSGAESLARFVSKLILSLESQMTIDVYNAFVTLMNGLPTTTTTGLQVSGYSETDLRRICAQIEAWTRTKPMVVGTSLALANVLPSTDVNYRWDLGTSEYSRLGYMQTAWGYNMLALPNIADHTTEWAIVISDSYLWILAPASGKLLKLVLEGATLSNTDSVFENGNLLQRSTMIKSYGIGVVTNSLAGLIAL